MAAANDERGREHGPARSWAHEGIAAAPTREGSYVTVPATRGANATTGPHPVVNRAGRDVNTLPRKELPSARRALARPPGTRSGAGAPVGSRPASSIPA